MKKHKWLYTPPPGAIQGRIEWHQEMLTIYQPLKARSVEKTLYTWLRKAGIDRDETESFGIVICGYSRWAMPVFANEAYSQVFDHGHVIKRRSDGRVYVIGEPYSTVELAQESTILQRWKGIGAEIVISSKSGWFPGRTISILIG